MVTRSRSSAATFLVAALFVLPGCAREVTRLSFTGPGAAEATAQLSDGEVLLSVDAEWVPAARSKGLTGLEPYRLTVAAIQGKRLAATTTCSPLRLASSGWSRQESATRVRVVANRLADCRLKLPQGGETKIRATLSEVRKPDARLSHLDLIVEQ